MHLSGFAHKHTIEHLQYARWPEYGTPPTPNVIISFIKNLFKFLATLKHDVKILVHGSNGVGRTGTFIALFELMEMLESKLSCYKQLESSPVPITDKSVCESGLDIFSCVLNLRRQRCEMVSRLMIGKKWENYQSEYKNHILLSLLNIRIRKKCVFTKLHARVWRLYIHCVNWHT